MQISPSLVRRPTAGIPATYDGLVRFYPPRPLHDEADLQNALEITKWLIGRDLNGEQADYLDAVATFIERYEKEQFPPIRVTGVAALEFLLETNEMNRKGLAKLLKVHPSIVTRILAKERNLKPGELRILSARFGVSTDLFLRA